MLLIVVENMAKQTGILKITGCRGNICFYKMEGKYYARMKSTLTGKRVKQDKKFERTRQLAGIFGRACKIASKVYWLLPIAERHRSRRYELIRSARKLLSEGVQTEDIVQQLLRGKEERIQKGTAMLRAVFTQKRQPLLQASDERSSPQNPIKPAVMVFPLLE